jgi:tRNA1(Val) A37 N6-methylase TrmN6
MALFQNSVLQKYLKQQDSTSVAKAYKNFTKYFHNPQIQENIRSSKEEEYQGIFLTELFSKILGYTMKPNADFNLVAEYKNEKNSKKADGAILKDEQAIAVIELKGTNTKDLEKIRQQAFDYKANQTGCVYVITSNYEKLRFYINNAVDFEEFDLFTLSVSDFDLLYLCLAKDNVLNNLPLHIKEASVQAEEIITKKFYKDYSNFKRELFRDLVKLNMKNEVFRAELSIEDSERGAKKIKHTLFKKSQKLIDRFLFIFFAEDRGLLPPNSTLQILEQWNRLKDDDAYFPLYHRYKLYFNYLDQGRAGKNGKAEIFAYNGGLFKPDPILDSLLISDQLLYKHTKELQAYDFESQVDVNILGHIFENSLNEIESVNAEIEGKDFDKQKSKRKKDGVFYTPKYITKYIVDNTVGKLCTEKKDELGVVEEEYFKSRKGRSKAKLKELSENLEAYREWLLHITILDPACGSGAFLNQALDFLIKEHQYIDQLQTNLLGGGLVFPDIENTVLENNIFGVDLNEESVEIARLSLWLRTAQPRRKLNDLSSNIKCGNSLIDSKAVAGDKAFKWEEEFPQIFAKGGFDVVIGNPPYVRPRDFQDKEKYFIIDSYESAENQFDLYHIFIEKSELLRNRNGVVSMILPNAFLANENSQRLRKYILENCHILKIIDCKQEVFKDASVDVLIYVFDNSTVVSKYYELSNNTFEFKHRFKANKFSKNKNLNFTPTLNIEALEVFQKIKKRTKQLGEFFDVMSGIKEYQTGKGKPSQVPEDKLERRFNATYRKDETYIKEIRGKHVQRYSLEWENEYVSYGNWLAEPRNPIYFEGKRLLVRQIPAKTSLIACFTDDYYVVDQSAYIIKPKNEELFNKGIIGILNSKLVFWFYRNENNEFDNLFPKIKAKEIRALPIVEKDLSILDSRVSTIETLTKEFLTCQNQFIKYFRSQFTIEKLPKKLQNWHDLDFGEFIKELNKAIKKTGGEPLSKLVEMDWMEVFETKKAEAQKLKAQIDKTDNEIDAMVYQLYGLTDEEIKIVENS